MENKETGRPSKVISKEQFEAMCGMQATKEEICDVLRVGERTLERWCHRTYGEPFGVVFKEKRGTGKMSLRRRQWKLAEKNAAMAIWLGKQYLGQREPEQQFNLAGNIDTSAKVEIYLPENKRMSTEEG